MNYKLKSLYEKYGRDREIVVWGTGAQSWRCSPEVAYLTGKEISFYISNNPPPDGTFMGKPMRAKESYDRAGHYLVVLSSRYRQEIKAEIEILGGRRGWDYCEYFSSSSLPADCHIGGCAVGKHSFLTMPQKYAGHIKSVGRFSSINISCVIGIDHPLNMISTARGGIWDCFNSDNKAEWRSNYRDAAQRLEIGNDVWIGAQTFINVSRVSSIGDGAIVGAGAVVNDNVPPYAVVAGQPARIIKYRFTPGQIETLLRVRWWDWDDEVINANAKLLIHPELFFEKFGAE
ncbi:MAG: CatB-related O-acetyltransferase [Desulfarculales bacterium]|jgi:acetyltransferase-like isoleucine patch superfamily enzyme|nr:CatB-related O-acetyltransferase [Desulfarculales bacterium]